MGGGDIMGMLGGGGGGDMMSMIPQLMRMANFGGGRPPASPAALNRLIGLTPCCAMRDMTPGNTGRPARAFGPHRVRITLAADSTPSTTIEAAASAKKFAARRIMRRQPPAADRR